MQAPAASSKFRFRPGTRPRSPPRLRRATTPIPTYSYELRDGYRQTQISTVANIGSGGTSNSSFVYDKNGDLKTVNYATNNVAIHAVNFVTDSTGQVIARTDRNVGATTGPTDYYYRFGGAAMSQVGNDGTADFDYATAIARRSATPTPGNLYRNGGPR